MHISDGCCYNSVLHQCGHKVLNCNVSFSQQKKTINIKPNYRVFMQFLSKYTYSNQNPNRYFWDLLTFLGHSVCVHCIYTSSYMYSQHMRRASEHLLEFHRSPSTTSPQHNVAVLTRHSSASAQLRQTDAAWPHARSRPAHVTAIQMQKNGLIAFHEKLTSELWDLTSTKDSYSVTCHLMRCFTSPQTQYRLYGRRFLQVKRPNQQYQSTEGESCKGKQPKEQSENTKYTYAYTHKIVDKYSVQL